MCPFCQTKDCPRQEIIDEKRKNPPTGMGGGLWIHGESFRSSCEECWRRRKLLSEDNES